MSSVLPVRPLVLALAAAGIASAVRALPEPRLAGWRRTNFRGESVSLSGGLAAGVGAVLGAALDPILRGPSLAAGVAALLGGGYDDLFAARVEAGADKGFSGHLSAARAGRVSGGSVKVAVIGAGALIAAGRLRPGSGGRRWVRGCADAALIAGCANVMNLFDLRPGRAAKLALVLGAAGGARGPFAAPAAAVLGATAVCLPGDLAERTMLGDLGANTLGALLGVRLAASGRRPRVLGAVVVGGLTLASEKVSFSRVIASVPLLRALDQFGRIPVGSRSPVGTRSPGDVGPVPAPR